MCTNPIWAEHRCTLDVLRLSDFALGGPGVQLGFQGSDQGLRDAVEEVARSVHVDCSVRR